MYQTLNTLQEVFAVQSTGKLELRGKDAVIDSVDLDTRCFKSVVCLL